MYTDGNNVQRCITVTDIPFQKVGSRKSEVPSRPRFSEFPAQKYVNKLIKCKIAANSFLVLVFEVLGLGFLDIHHPNSLDNIVHNAAKGQLNLRKTPRCFGRRTC